MRTKWLTMDLGENDGFAVQHPYFFGNFTFKFEGFPAEIQKAFESAVEDMDAVVSDNAEYVLTDVLYSPALDPTKNYYSVSFLSDSILAKEPLDIEDYKFSNLIESTSNCSDFCCANGKYIWRTKSCKRYFNQNFYCKYCFDELLKEGNDRGLNQVNGESNVLDVDNVNEESQRLHIDTSNEAINGSQCDKSSEKANNVRNMQKNLSDENLICSTEKSKLSEIKKTSSIDRWKVKSSSSKSDAQPQASRNYQESGVDIYNSYCDSNDIEMTEMQNEVVVEKPSCSMQKSAVSKTKKKSIIAQREKKDRLVSSSESDSTSENDFTAQPQVNQNFPKNKVNRNKCKLKDTEMTEMLKDVDVAKPSCSTQQSKVAKIKKKPIFDRMNKKERLISSSESDSASDNDFTARLQVNGKSQKNKVNRYTEMTEAQNDVDIVKPSCSMQQFEVSKTKKKPSINRWKKRIIYSESESSDENEDLNKHNRKHTVKRLKISSSDESNSDGREWWEKLPKRKNRMKKKKREYDYAEKQLMIAYLVTNNMIEYSCSRRPWQCLVDDGYLKRTEESLSNHFRKSILPNIESFELPKDIEKKFINCRKIHQNLK